MARTEGSKTRARRSREAWRQSIEDWCSSGLSQVEFCKRHNLALSTFRWWRRRLSEEAHDETCGFVELHVAPEPESPGDRAELMFPSGVRLCVPPGWNRRALVEVLRALEEVGSC